MVMSLTADWAGVRGAGAVRPFLRMSRMTAAATASRMAASASQIPHVPQKPA
ncbi:MAG: hypothetical protein ACLSCR_10475 [Akkermansia sp.]